MQLVEANFEPHSLTLESTPTTPFSFAYYWGHPLFLLPAMTSCLHTQKRLSANLLNEGRRTQSLFL